MTLAPFDANIVLGMLPTAYPKLLSLIQAVPISTERRIFDAETPFSCYCFIRNLCLLSSTRIDIVDRYLDHGFFHRYLYETVVSPKVTLVTLPQPALGSKDAPCYKEFVDVSRLYAQEHGPDKYRLLTLLRSDFHDRWLRCDNELFLLGGSPKDLKQWFTIGKVDPTSENMGKSMQ